MTTYAVAYRVTPGDAPDDPVPVFDGVAAPGPPPAAGPRTCTATTRSGEPCKGRAGDDGLCAAHKGATDAASADQAAAEDDSQAEDGEAETENRPPAQAGEQDG